jgi:hypothetical protein
MQRRLPDAHIGIQRPTFAEYIPIVEAAVGRDRYGNVGGRGGDGSGAAEYRWCCQFDGPPVAAQRGYAAETNSSGGDVAYTPNLAKLLTAGARYVEGRTTYVVESHPLGQVVLPTGQVVGCDPLVFADAQPPFTVTIPPGAYPLHAWVAVLHHDGGSEWERRVAALQLVIRAQPTIRWELALTDGQDQTDLGDGEYFGYIVDAGTATLADLTAARALEEWDFDQVDKVFVAARLPEKPVPGAIGAVTDQATGANILTVCSGWGDGVYPTFVGYTPHGEVASFVTDFMVVPDGNGDHDVQQP